MRKFGVGVRLRSSVAAIVVPIIVIGFGAMAMAQPAVQSAAQLSENAQSQPLGTSGDPQAAMQAATQTATQATALGTTQALPQLDDPSELRICTGISGPVAHPADLMEQPESAAGREIFAQILATTNLPMNFTVIEAAVPQVTAMILEQGDLAPRRVIAISAAGLAQAKEALDRKDWALIAQIAHESAHHLAGHGLANGPLRGQSEAEAQAFAGLVLARLGAEFSDVVTVAAKPDLAAPSDGSAPLAATALAGASIPQPQYADLEALAAGWGRGAMEEGRLQPAILPFAQAADPTRPQPKPDGGADAALRAQTRQAAAIAWMDELGQLAPAAPASGKVNARLPLPDPRALPVKFDHFVYDPLGLVNEKEIASLERDAIAYATTPGVEIVTIVADNLHGYSARDYAQIMLRQLSVGQRDLGNGAVVVVAPKEGASAVALAPGLATALTGLDGQTELERRAAAFVEGLMQGADPKVPTVAMGLTEAAHAIMRRPEIANADWTLHYGTLGAALRAREQNWAERAKTNAIYDPAKDPVLYKIVRLRARVTGADATAPVPGAAHLQDGDEAQSREALVLAGALPLLSGGNAQGSEKLAEDKPSVDSPLDDNPLDGGKTDVSPAVGPQTDAAQTDGPQTDGSQSDHPQTGAIATVAPGLVALYGHPQTIATAEGAGYLLLSDPQAAAPGPLLTGREYEITARIVENVGDRPVLALISREDVTPQP